MHATLEARCPSLRSTLKSSLSPPSAYVVGRRRTYPLVHARHLEGHLALLRAFDALRHDIESGDPSRFPQDVRTLDAKTRWAWFVNLAVERFHRWCNSIRDVQGDVIESTLPPIDVVMVWHTYLLNPIWYAEDTLRVPTLSSLPRYTEYLTIHLDSPELLLTNTPHPDRVQFWRNQTMTPYDPLTSTKVLTHATLQCPYCESSIQVPILAPEGRGYAQSKFAVSCPSCCGRVTKELLGLHKLAKDVVREENDGPGAFLAGTLHSRDEMKDTRRAALIKHRVRSRISIYSGRVSASRRPKLASDVMKALDYDPYRFAARLRAALLSRIANRIIHAYSDDRPFSVELVGAVLRQGSFVCKMAELGWTQPDFLSGHDSTIILEHCVTRYHAFLNLIATLPETFLVPTLDIDLTWHTHQLMAARYQKDCKTFVERYVDHDDKVEENHLATAFDATCRVWIDQYKVPYTHCGCPHPGTTLSQRLLRAFERHHPANGTLQPPDTATPGTHPSDHNAVFLMHHHRSSVFARERRRQKAERRWAREAREAAEGKTTTRMAGAGHDAARRTNPHDHPEPFLYPVPMYYVPFGGCIAGVGGVVDGGESASFGSGQCASGIGGGCGYGSVGCGVSACGGGGGGGGGISYGGGGGGCGGGGCN